MAFQSKFLYLRHAFLLAALFLTLTLAGWSDSVPPSAGPVVSPTNGGNSAKSAPDATPGAGPGQTPGVDLPEKAKPAIPPVTVPEASASPSDDAPIDLP